jgi:hypothetical protein
MASRNASEAAEAEERRKTDEHELSDVNWVRDAENAHFATGCFIQR